MKKLIIVSIALIVATALGFTFYALSVCRHTDTDGDGLCDKCGKAYEDEKDVPEDPACEHRDADDDALCDKCGAYNPDTALFCKDCGEYK